MVVVFVMTLIGGVFAFRQLNIEAYPDPTPPMVDVITQSEGLSAEEIERYITIPIEAQTSNLKNLNTIRSVSLSGWRSCRRCRTAHSHKSRRSARSARCIAIGSRRRATSA